MGCSAIRARSTCSAEAPSPRPDSCPTPPLNFAENLLAERAGAGEHAIIFRREDGVESFLSWERLRADVAAAAAVLTEAGVGIGDRVAVWMPHCPETIVAFLAAASIGAVFTSTSSDFGVDGVVDRFGQTEPTVLVAADGYRYGGREFDCLQRLHEIQDRLPTVTKTLVVGYLDEQPQLQPDAPADGDRDGATELWSAALARHEGRRSDSSRFPAITRSTSSTRRARPGSRSASSTAPVASS